MKLELNDTEESGIRELIRLCNQVDGTSYDMSPEGDFYYLIENPGKEESGVKAPILAALFGYRIGERKEGKEVLEISAFTHPSFRQQGAFHSLYDALRDDFREFRYHFLLKPLGNKEGIENGILPEDTKAALSALHFELLHWELFMKKTLRRGISDPGDSLSNQYGEVHLTPYNERTLYLYGLLVYDRYLRQGYGRAMLKRLEQGEAGEYEEILLQVSSRNTAALSLYQSMGYEIIDRSGAATQV